MLLTVELQRLSKQGDVGLLAPLPPRSCLVATKRMGSLPQPCPSPATFLVIGPELRGPEPTRAPILSNTAICQRPSNFGVSCQFFAAIYWTIALAIAE